MSITVITHNSRKTDFKIDEKHWTAIASIEYIEKPIHDIVHHEGCSVLLTSDNTFIQVSVCVEPCQKREITKNIETFAYHNFVCAEAWALLWGKLYAVL